SLGVLPRTLWRRLDERRLIACCDQRRHTTKVTIGSRRVRGLHLRASALADPGPSTLSTSGAIWANGAEAGAAARDPAAGSRPARIRRADSAAAGHSNGAGAWSEDAGERTAGVAAPLAPIAPIPAGGEGGLPGARDDEDLGGMFP